MDIPFMINYFGLYLMLKNEFYRSYVVTDEDSFWRAIEVSSYDSFEPLNIVTENFSFSN